MTFFNPNIPLASTNYADWQSLFLANFSQLNRAFSENHVPLTGGATTGNHTIVELVEQESDTQFQTRSTEMSLYCKDVDGQTDQVFIRYPSNGTEFEYTNYQIYDLHPEKIGASIRQTQNFTVLPGKIICYFGSVLSADNSGKDITAHISLNPPVAKNLLTVNSVGIGGSFDAGLAAIRNMSGYINKINVSFVHSVPFRSFYYIALANI